MHICVKWLNSLDEPVPMLELIWVRMAITSICSVLAEDSDPLLGPKGVRGLLVLRGFTGFVGLAGMYASLVHLSLSDATMLTFVAPILTGLSGAIILKETVSLWETFAGFCSFFGVILIARPEFLFGGSGGDLSDTVTHGQRMQSVAFSLIGVLGATAAYTTLRAIGKRAHTLHSLVFFSSSCVLGSTVGMVIFKTSPVMPTRPLWLAMLLLLGVLDLTSQSLLVMGFQRETASRGVLACYTSVIFAAMFDFIVFRTTPTALSIAGAAIIISAAISISVLSSHSSHIDIRSHSLS
ncbi:hypothetical protein BJV77DRAFT_1037055 [Russula vinacea]|nr:hypothetical protein BJV77DRAFT_1037055 [Russula vinacea]